MTWLSRTYHRASAAAGFSLIYAMVSMVALTGFVSLAVDLGRVQIAKTELQQAADAAAMYGASGLKINTATVLSRAIASGADNKVDGQTLVITNSDIEFGVWDPSTKTFTVMPTGSESSATAIRVTARRSAARGTGVPTFFGRVVGQNTVDAKAVAIAARGHVTYNSVQGDSCPWLAGMPSGSSVAATGGNTQNSTAPNQSPAQMTGLNLAAGTHLTFRQASGQTSYAGAGNIGPDGDTSWIVGQAQANGINTTYAPIQSLVGIFIDDRAPSTWSAQSSLDFSTSASRDFSTLSPGLKQVFFIGDGMNSSGSLQEFVVPTGATRLYVGLMDEKGWWWDNTGTLSLTTLDDDVMLVK
jgi:hypothetical protein